MNITKYLVDTYRFTPVKQFSNYFESVKQERFVPYPTAHPIYEKYLKPKFDVDIDLFTAVLRVHELHYLFYSETYKHFSIAVKYEEPKGMAGGGFKQYNIIMLPRVIRTKQDADEFLKGMLGDQLWKNQEKSQSPSISPDI